MSNSNNESINDYAEMNNQTETHQSNKNENSTMNNNSFALGHNATANGGCSFALGYNATANESYSFALGYNVETHNNFSLVCGQYNDPLSWALFAVGCGSTPSKKKNKICTTKTKA